MMEEIMPILITTLGTIASVLGAVLIMFIRKWANKLMAKYAASEAEKEAIAALMAGVELAQEEFVLELKRAAEDGKLTKEERKKALDIAITHAKSIAKGAALDLIEASSQERLGAWVKQILASWSKK